jgi:ATP-dependent RNA helicase DDX24/MAK5
MSEYKQRRELMNINKKFFSFLVVATPGRLSQLVEADDIVAFQDLSLLRFLVVDEADRIMEDGHFPEVIIIFFSIFFVILTIFFFFFSM